MSLSFILRYVVDMKALATVWERKHKFFVLHTSLLPLGA